MRSTFDLPPWFWLPLGLVGGVCFALAFYGTTRWLDRPQPEEVQTPRVESLPSAVPPATFAPQPEMPDGTEQALSALSRQGAQVGKEVVYGEPARRWAQTPPQPVPPSPSSAKPRPAVAPPVARPSPSPPWPTPLPTAVEVVLMDDLNVGSIDAEGPPDRAQEARFLLAEPLGNFAAGSTVYAVPRLVDEPTDGLPVHFYVVRVETGTMVWSVPFGHWLVMEPGDRPIILSVVPEAVPQGANPVERETEPQFQLTAGRNLILKTVVPWNP